MSGCDNAADAPKVVSSKQGNPRVTGKEQYYTSAQLAERLCGTMFELVPDAVARPWVEPAGGTGSFISALQNRGVKRIVSYDIEPHHPAITKADFLEVSVSGEGYAAISNPPFGRANKLCIPFFNKLANHCDYIGFIVPKSWRKWSVQNRLDRRFFLIHDEDLVVNYVDVAGQPLADGKMQLNTVFQVWERRDALRPIIKVEDRGYITKTTPAAADVSLTVFGRGCGTVKTEFLRVPNTTQMFLKLHNEKALEALQNANFKRFYENVAYIEALSIQEINYAINEYLDSLPNGSDSGQMQARA